MKHCENRTPAATLAARETRSRRLDLQQLLGDIPKARFVADVFHRQPFAQPRTASSLCDIVTWGVLDSMLRDEDADVMVVKKGRQCPDAAARSEADARALLSRGHTVLIRHAERHDARLAELAASFADDFRAAVDVHVYLTAPGEHGFSWHYDAEDVFIIQASGKKEYSLRKNTVHPWPLVETIPRDMQYEREVMPLLRTLLAPGDWLYIPNGYWHRAQAVEGAEPSISVALGVLSPSAIDLLDYLRRLLPDSLLWRARLPVVGAAAACSADQLLEEYRQLAQLLADDLARVMTDEEVLKKFLAVALPRRD